MNDVKILPAKADQWGIIQALNSQVYLADKDNDEDLIVDQPFTEGNIEYYKKLARGEYGHCAIAYLNDEPVGYIALAEIKFGHRKGKYLELDNMGLMKRIGLRGLGRSFLNMPKNGQSHRVLKSCLWWRIGGINKRLTFIRRMTSTKSPCRWRRRYKSYSPLSTFSINI